MKNKMIAMAFLICLHTVAQATENLSFIDRNGITGKVTLETEQMGTCDSAALADSGKIEYGGSARPFRACWDQHRVNEKVVIGVASTNYMIDFTMTLVLSPEYLETWGAYQEFEHSTSIRGCGAKNAGAIFKFGTGLDVPIESRFICLDR